MKWMLLIALISALLSGNTLAQNEWGWEAAQALAITAADSVKVTVKDAVSGGCMRPDGIERAAEVQLRRNNIKLADNYWTPMLIISAIGGRTTSKGGTDLGCSVAINLGLSIMIMGIPVPIDPAPEPFGYFSLIFSNETLFVGDPMQKRLENWVQEQVDELFLEIQRSKDFLDKNHPGIREKYRPL
jgi:hypothetical protein